MKHEFTPLTPASGKGLQANIKGISDLCFQKHQQSPHPLVGGCQRVALLWAENSAMSTLNLGDRLCGFPFHVTQCEVEHGGDRNQLPSSHRWEGTVKPIHIQRDSKTRHSNSSSWLLNWILAKERVECFPFLIQQQTKRRKEQRSAIHSPREVGRNVSHCLPSDASWVSWNSCCYYEHAPAEEKRDKASTSCLAPGISDTDELQTEARGPPRHEKW